MVKIKHITLLFLFLISYVQTACPTSCLTCDDSETKCLTCDQANDMYLANTTPILCYLNTATVPGFFFNTQISTFDACHINCQNCSELGDNNDNKCTSCNTGSALINNNCYDINSPPTGYSWSTLLTRFVYSPCYLSCTVCDGPGDDNNHNCFTCKDLFFKKQGTKNCYNMIPKGFYFNNNVFSPCDSSCETCDNGTSCRTCANNKYKSANSNFCVDNCPIGYFQGIKVCNHCPSSCNSCSDAVTCTACANGYTLSNNRCASTCQIDQYIDTTGNCVTCPNECATCDNAFNCKTCKPGFFLFKNSCIKTCPDRTYYNGSTCTSCISLCAKCSEAKYCLQCDPLSFTRVQTVFGVPKYTCSNLCEEGRFVVDGICKTCAEIGKVLENNVCVDSCSPGNYSDNGVCKSCLSSGRFIYDGQCVNYCPNNYLWGFNQNCFPNNLVMSYNINSVLSNDIIECTPNPCRNNGICSKNGNNVTCSCDPNFWGSRCEFVIDRGIIL